MSSAPSLLGRLRALAVLGSACAVGGAAVVPYQLLMAPLDVELPFPWVVLCVLSGIQNGLLGAVLGGLGWLAAGLVGLKTPVLDRLAGNSQSPLPSWAAVGAGAWIGAGVAAGVALVDLWFLLPALPAAKVPFAEAPMPIALMASIYGGVNEEVLTRLFLVSGLAWGLSLPARRAGRSTPGWAIGAAIAISALGFGLLHLPAAAMLWDLTPAVVGRILLLNCALAAPFGLIYWRWGLSVAMVAHFSADVVLHVLAPLLS